MPRTTVTPQRIDVAGTALATEPANVLGNSLAIASNRALFVNNASGAAVTVTLPTTATLDGLTVGNRTVSVPAGAARYIRPSATAAQPGGLANVDYSAVTSVTVAVLEL